MVIPLPRSVLERWRSLPLVKMLKVWEKVLQSLRPLALQNLLPILATVSSVSVYNRHAEICGCCLVGLVLSVRHNTSLLISAFLYICLWFLHSLVVQVNSQQHWMQQGGNILTECCVCTCIPHYIWCIPPIFPGILKSVWNLEETHYCHFSKRYNF